MPEPINIRVYKRGYHGTILLWNVEPLTEEQRKNVAVYVQRVNDKEWITPTTGMPDITRMAKAKDEQTDTIMIMHNEPLTQSTPFNVKLVFGKGETGYQEATYFVAPANSHRRPFTKPRRMVTDGKIVYAESVNIVGVEKSVVEQIAEAVANKLRGG